MTPLRRPVGWLALLPLAIGMGGVLVYLEVMYFKTGEDIYEAAAKFWTCGSSPPCHGRPSQRIVFFALQCSRESSGECE